MTYNDDFAKYEKLRAEKMKKKKKPLFGMNSTASLASVGSMEDPFMYSRDNIMMRTPEESKYLRL